AQGATVEELCDEAGGRWQLTRQQQVADPLLVAGDAEPAPAFEEGEVDAALELTLALRTDVRRAGGALPVDRRQAADVAAQQLGELLPELRQVPRIAECHAELGLIHAGA